MFVNDVVILIETVFLLDTPTESISDKHSAHSIRYEFAEYYGTHKPEYDTNYRNKR